MGYRSDVVFAMYKEDHFTAILLENTFPPLLNNSEVFKKTDIGNTVYLTASHIKWYESYVSIAEIERFMSHLDDQNIAYGFIRLGEHDDDIDKHGDPYNFELSVSRFLDMPFEVNKDFQ